MPENIILNDLQKTKEKTLNEIALYNLLITEERAYKLEFENKLKALQASLAEVEQIIYEIEKEEKSIVTPRVLPRAVSPSEQKSSTIIYYNPPNRKVRVQPICSFTEAEKQKMRRYIEDGDDLDDAATKPLVNATIYDEIMMDYNFDPGLVITEGQINSFQFLKDYYQLPHPYVDRSDPTNTPHKIFKKTPTLDLPSTEDDVIPCNTLLRALQLLLVKAERWEKGDKTEPRVPELKKPLEKRKYTSLTEKEVEILEVIYKCLPPSRQLMFNVIVRDGDEIMNKAVILPDGYVYDASVAEKQLKRTSAKGKFPAIFEGYCPSNPAITFKVVRDEKDQDIYSEIKPALYYDNIIKILKNNVAYFQKVIDVESMKPLHDSALSEERDVMILKLSRYLEKIERTIMTETENTNENDNLIAIKENQKKVVEEAIKGLQQLDAKKFNDVIKQCSAKPEQSYDAVKTKFNGINTGRGFLGKIYRIGAYLTGTIHGQIGVEMPTIVSRVNDLLLRCEKSLELSKKFGN